MNDIWDILGIPAYSETSLIKEAYRKKAKECHPDILNDNGEKFRQLKEAYDKAILYKPRKVGGFFKKPPAKNSDIYLHLDVDISVLYKNENSNIVFDYEKQIGKNIIRCRIPPLTIPEDCLLGSRYNIPEHGNQENTDKPPGRLNVKIFPYPSEFRTEENSFDVSYTKEIDMLEAIIGGDFLLNIPDGRTVNIKIPQNSDNTTKLCLKKYGLKQKGNLFIDFIIKKPNYSPQQIDKIRKFVKSESFLT